MDATLSDIVGTFETALGPFGDPAVIALARALPQTLPAPEPLRVLMQVHARIGVRFRAVLLTVAGDTLSLRTAESPWHECPLESATIVADEVRLAGRRVALTPAGGDRLTLQRAMPIDEIPRLVAIAAGAEAADSVPARPPVARLGAATRLYEDRIAFADAPTRSLAGGVRARTIELPASAGTTLRSVSRLLQGARGKPQHVLIDGPGWSHVAPAPETAPELAEAFAEAVNRWAAGLT